MKKTFSFLILALGITVYLMTSVSSCGVSTGTTNSVSNFTAVSSWTGSLGEVISSVTVDGTNIYAAAGPDGLYIFNTGLTYLGKFSTNVYPIKDVVVKTYSGSKFAVVANGLYNSKGGTMMIYVGDLTNLYATNLSEYSGRSPNALAVNDDVTNIYTADQFVGFQTYTNGWNIASLTNKVATLSSPGNDIAYSGTKVYVAAKTGGVYVIDYTANNSVLANITTTLFIANAVAVSGSGDGTLLAVGDSLGLVLFNMDTPDSPSKPRYLCGYYGSAVYDVAINGSEIYIALGTGGVAKLKFTPPSTLALEKQYSDGAAYYKIFYNSSTGYVYAACGKDGVRILK